jgi:DNA polymerase-3 subunit epsilon
MSEDIVVVVIDTETTGLEPQLGAEIVELAVRFGLQDTAETKFWRVRPLLGIPAEATAVHGITMGDVRECPTFGEVAGEIARTLERADVIVGYNPDYDIRMITAEMERSECSLVLNQVVIDCKRLWDIYEPRPDRTLANAYKRFVDPAGFENAHGALKDAHATAVVLREQLKQLNLGELGWPELDPERQLWWGPSSHVLLQGKVLVCNFGKHRGEPFHKLNPGMLRWIMREAFPWHVRDLADRASRIKRRQKEENMIEELYTWAKMALP